MSLSSRASVWATANDHRLSHVHHSNDGVAARISENPRAAAYLRRSCASDDDDLADLARKYLADSELLSGDREMRLRWHNDSDVQERFDRVDEIIFSSLSDGIQLIMALCRAADGNERFLSEIGAGPIENLIWVWGDRARQEIAARIPICPDLETALGSVW